MNRHLMIKDLLMGKAFFAVNKRAIKKYGYIEAGILCVLCDYETTSRERTFDGWFPVTAESIQNELNIGRKPYDSAVANLKSLGLINTSVRGVPARKFFRLEYSIIQTSLFDSDNEDCPIQTDLFVQNEQSSLSKTDKLECPKRTGLNNIVVKEDNIKKTSIKEEKENDSYVEDAFRPAWELWLKHKSELKKPYKTPTTLRAAYEKLVYELSNHDSKVAMLVVKQSVENGWEGLFPLKANANGDNNSKQTNQSSSAIAANTRAAFGDVKRQCAMLLGQCGNGQNIR